MTDDKHANGRPNIPSGLRANPVGSALSEFIDYQPWMERANCVGTDGEAFFPEIGGSTKAAKLVCSRCEVREDCLDWAVANEERFGVFGGLSERERRKIERGETVPFRVKRRKPHQERPCAHCGEPFTGPSTALYCCASHRRAAQQKRHNDRRRGAA